MQIEVRFERDEAGEFELVARYPPSIAKVVTRSEVQTGQSIDKGYTLKTYKNRQARYDGEPNGLYDYRIVGHDCEASEVCLANNLCEVYYMYKLKKYQEEFSFMLCAVIQLALDGTPIEECSLTMEIPDE